jgi:polysaccharide export outer membrane protein
MVINPDAPNERQKTVLGEYVIEPPDLLQIDLLYAVPLPPYKLQPLDVLNVSITTAGAPDALSGTYQVDPDGTVPFGGRQGSVKIAGLSLADAREVVEKHLSLTLNNPKVTLTVAQGRGVQLVRGQHLVRPDGTVDLGSYGSVMVAGQTVANARLLIQTQLAQTLQNPEVLVSVIGYNSKVYYVIFDYGGAGQQMIRMPVTGNDTVLDAISQLGGLSTVSDPGQVWVARSAALNEPDQVLPVDWDGLTRRGRAETNYQLLPGDRLFVKAYRLVSAEVRLARMLAPVERVLGVTLLGASTYTGIYNDVHPNRFGNGSSTGTVISP